MAEQKKGPGRPAGSKNKTTDTKAKTTKPAKAPKKAQDTERAAKVKAEAAQKVIARSKMKDEIWAIVIMAIGVFMGFAVFTSMTGKVGDIVKDIFFGLFGQLGYVFPVYVFIYGFLLILGKAAHANWKSFTFSFIVFWMFALLNSLRYITDDMQSGFSFIKEFWFTGIAHESAGVLGMLLGCLLVEAIGKVGVGILAGVVILSMLLLVLNTPVSQIFETIKIRRAQKEAERRLALQEAEEAIREQQRIEAEEAKRAEAEALKAEKEAAKLAKEAAAAATTTAKPKTAHADTLDTLEEITDETPQDKLTKAAQELTDDQTHYVPGTMSKGQINIMNMMKNDDLFDNASKGTGYGLEPASDVQEGYGLHGYKPSGTGTGLGTGIGATAVGAAAAGTGIATGLATGLSGNDAHEINTIEDLPEIGGADDYNAPRDMSHVVDGPVVDTIVPDFVDTLSGTVTPVIDADKKDEPDDMVYDSDIREQAKLTNSEARNASLNAQDFNTPHVKPYVFPPIDLLKKGPQESNQNSQSQLSTKAMKLEETLASFGVDARVIQVTQGPAVTRYEVQPAVGVKVSRIVSLQDDIALNLAARSIRIEAPIPGKAAVGIEIGNEKSTMVPLRDIVESKEFQNAKSKLSFAVGRDISGNSIVGNVADMPHMLIAGSTGSGKSVCINSIILSLLYKAKPEEVKLILIDPKVVELSNYNGIPHLLIPVVTDPAKAAAALNWAVAEMDDRYNKFQEEGVRDMASYNVAVTKKGEPEKVYPSVVIIIDELADLMMTAPSQVEESIARLAQKARAAGMHLIVATQRPSVDVVTGTIKANIASRIAFAVSSQVDSRTILDGAGAEKLVGKGDMLYRPLGKNSVRVQGTFVSDDEVNNVIDYVKGQCLDTEYNAIVMDTIENSGANAGKGGNAGGAAESADELLPDAIEFIVGAGKASVSMLQRRFRIGYNRAARLIDEMEERGIIGPADGARPRDVLITETDLYAMKGSVEGHDDGGSPDEF